jgi:hypothetical protein
MTYRNIYLENLTQVIAMLKDVWWPRLQPGFSTVQIYTFTVSLFFSPYPILILVRVISVGYAGP